MAKDHNTIIVNGDVATIIGFVYIFLEPIALISDLAGPV